MPFPPKLTLAAVDRIVQQVAAGMSVRGAFRTAGAPPREKTALASGAWFTVRAGFRWLEIGNRVLMQVEDGERDVGTLTEHEELCAELVLRLEQALGLSEAHWIGKLQSGTGRDAARWQWLLERKLPAEYRGVQRLEHTGADGGPVATTSAAKVVMLPALELEALVTERANDEEGAGDVGGPGGDLATEPGTADRVPRE